MAARYQIKGVSAAEVAASIEAGVRDGELPPGAGLPAVRSLAASLDLSPATVASAYRTLRQRGVVETAGRNGTRVRSRPPIRGPRAARRMPAPPGARDLSTGEPDPRLLPPLAEHLHRLGDAVGPPVSYSGAGPLPELVEAARDRLAADGVPASAGAVTITGGALDAIERLLTAHLRPGDRVAVEDPGWANLLDLVAALGMEPVAMPVDDDGPRPAGLRQALASGVRAAVITARAQNPTGAVVTSERAAALRSALADRPEVLLIEDDHAAELADEPLHPLAGATASWAFVRSVSKPYGPDLRLAVVAGDEATVARVEGRMLTGAGWVSTLLQRLVLALWLDRHTAAVVAAARESYQRRRAALQQELAARGVAAHGRGGINVWVPVPDETTAVAVLREAGYAVAPGALFRLAAGPGVRITVSQLEPGDVAPLADAVAAAVSPGASARHAV